MSPLGTPPEASADLAIRELLAGSHLAAPYELAELFDSCARTMGARGAVAYISDLQQHVLLPLVDPRGPGPDRQLTPLSIDATLAGRAFQTFEAHTQDGEVDGARVWLPMLVGTDRIGVLSVTVDDVGDFGTGDTPLALGLGRLAATAANLVVTKEPYGDSIVRLRRRSAMGLAAELQYSLLPPLTFASRPVTLSAALEPCYKVAGDTIDYAVDAGLTQVAVFDGMGHGLHSAQCAVLTVAAYRNARRAGLSLTDMMLTIDDALTTGLGGEVFTTGVLARLDTDTGRFDWVNAGHPEPLLLRGGRMVRALTVEPRPPLGLGHLVKTDVSVGTEQLEPGDCVLFYTDGVVEARAPNGEFFGVERLTDLVIRHLAGGLPAPETMRRVVRQLLDHQQDQLSDDATLLLLEWRSGMQDALLA